MRFVQGTKILEDVPRPLHILELVVWRILVLDIDGDMVAVECLEVS